MLLAKGACLRARSLLSITTVAKAEQLTELPFSRAVLAPAGHIEMPPCRVLNPPNVIHDFPGGWGYPKDPFLKWHEATGSIFPSRIVYPDLWVARLDDAYYLPYSAPFFPHTNLLINDFLVPWSPNVVAWFRYEAHDVYSLSTDVTEAYAVDTAFYLGHPISGHFGHFIGDCLSRMHAWRICQELFGEVKLILDHTAYDTAFREKLLVAAGIRDEDIIFAQGGIHCRRLLLANPALGVSKYASPTSATLWNEIRDGFGNHQVGHRDRIYMSRSRQPARKLTNETEIEDLFRSFGFSILYPETLSIEEQVASVSMAELIAGPSGSAMFNLAFHKRLKSVFMIVPETFIQISEWLFLAGTSCPMYYHVGSLSTAVDGISARRDSWEVNVQRLASDVAMWLSQIGTTQ